MSTSYDQFLGNTNPFAGGSASSSNISAPKSPTIAGATNTSGGLSSGSQNLLGNYSDPRAQQAWRQQQANMEKAWLYGSPPAQPTLMTPGKGMGGGVNTNSAGSIGKVNGPGGSTYQRIGQGQSPSQFGGGGAGGFGDQGGTPSFTEAGMSDVEATQKKADAQWQRKNDQARSLSDQLDRNREAMGQSLDATNQDTRDAEAKFLDSIEGFKDRTAQDSSAIARGIRQNFQSRMEEASQYTRADGTMKTQNEMDAEKDNLRNEVDAQIQQTLAPIASQYNAASAGMKQQYSSFLTANAQIRSAQQLQAIQYDLQGRNYLYEYISQNPETHVNLLDTLLAVANASGGGGAWTQGNMIGTDNKDPAQPAQGDPAKKDAAANGKNAWGMTAGQAGSGNATKGYVPWEVQRRIEKGSHLQGDLARSPQQAPGKPLKGSPWQANYQILNQVAS